MKKLVFIFCIAVAASSLSAQHHFPKDSAEWKVAHVRSDAGQVRTSLVVYRYFGDTIMDNKHYKHLRLTTEPGNHFLRIDTLQDQIFVRPDTNWALGVFLNGDNLLYDFSKSVGDTIKILDFGTRDTIRWYVIKDSVMTIGGQQRRFIDVRRNYFGYLHTDRWVEGIGSLNEFLAPAFEPSGYFEFAFQIVCFSDLGSSFQYEPDSLGNIPYNCNSNISIGQEQIIKSSIVHSYPNPFNEELQIENTSDAALHFSLISPTGAEWASGRIGAYQKTAVDTRHLPEGIYLIRYYSENISGFRKLVKK